MYILATMDNSFLTSISVSSFFSSLPPVYYEMLTLEAPCITAKEISAKEISSITAKENVTFFNAFVTIETITYHAAFKTLANCALGSSEF